MMKRPILDRRPQWDERNDKYPAIRTVSRWEEPRSYTWSVGRSMYQELFLDQGEEGACVGYSFAHELAAKPQIVLEVGADDAKQIYKWAQKNDPWPGEDYSGTSVLAGAKCLVDHKYYKSYAWTKNANELAVVVSRRGPAVLGINWHEDMWKPDGNGFISPSGAVIGGHAILCKGYSKSKAAFRLHNSWGKGWGQKGCAWLSLTDMQSLLDADGEACLPLRSEYRFMTQW